MTRKKPAVAITKAEEQMYESQATGSHMMVTAGFWRSI